MGKLTPEQEEYRRARWGIATVRTIHALMGLTVVAVGAHLITTSELLLGVIACILGLTVVLLTLPVALAAVAMKPEDYPPEVPPDQEVKTAGEARIR